MSQAMSAAASYPLAKGKAVHSAAAKIGLYRECLTLARAVKDERIRRMSIREVQDKWRECRGHGGQSLELAIASALDRVSYARLCTSKARLRGIPCASERYDWGVQNPLESHQAMATKRHEEKAENSEEQFSKGNRDFVPMTNWGKGNMDPDMSKRHKELMDRQFFMGPHWRGKPKPLIYEDLSVEEQITAHFSPPPKLPPRVKKNY